MARGGAVGARGAPRWAGRGGLAAALLGCGGAPADRPAVDPGAPAPPAVPAVDAGCPEGPWSCNGEDDDCNGAIDEPGEDRVEGYADADADGFGAGSMRSGCAVMAGDARVSGDCDDADPAVHPGAFDPVGDGVDGDCAGGDATCADPPAAWIDGDLELVGADAGALAAAACARASGVRGAVRVQEAAWTDLSALGCLCVVEDGLRILANPALRSVEGLAPGLRLGLRLDLRENPELADLRGLSAVGWAWPLREPAALLLSGLPALPDLRGLEGVDQLDDLLLRGPGPAELAGLEGLIEVHGSLELRGLAVTGLAPLGGLRRAGELRLQDLPGLSSLDGLDQLGQLGALTLRRLPTFAHLGGAPALRRIDEALVVEGVDGLSDLAGLEALTALGDLELLDNPALRSAAGLSVVTLSGGIRIRGNPELLDLRGLEGLQGIGGDLWIGDEDGGAALQALAGLDGLRVIGGDLRVVDAPALPDLRGLGALERVGGDLLLQGSAGAAPFDGLGALREVAGELGLRGHPAAEDLRGLERLEEVGELTIRSNPYLRRLDGLGGLRRAGALDVAGNPVLEDISALYGVEDLGSDPCVEVPLDLSEPAALYAAQGWSSGC